jgi:pimeloyl-ACP methyl ester carboxylesterase
MSALTAPFEIERGETRLDGILVEHARPVGGAVAGRPPIVFVHGGCHGSWMWAHFLGYFAASGWDCRALNWYGHGGSEALPRELFVGRSIGDVRTEISMVVAELDRPPVIIAHSMGGLAGQKYAESEPLEALVLLTPVVPAEVGGAVVELPIEPDEPWGPPPSDVAQDLFFQGVPHDEALELHAKLVPESPVAVHEATRWTLSVDLDAVARHAILVFGAELDLLTPPDVVSRLAAKLSADYVEVPGKGHSLPMEPGWRETADTIATWLARRV